MRQYIRFKEAWNYFSSLSLDEEKQNCKIEDFSRLNCIRRIYIKCSKKYILDWELLDERRLVFAVAKVSMNNNDEYHLRMVKTLYNSLTGQREQNEPDWVKIGFQTQEFKSDLRSVGMFAILQALAFTDRLTAYSHEIFDFAQRDGLGFPLMLVLINLTYSTLCSLREGYLIPFCNSKKSVINTLNEFYFGLVAYFLTIYKSTGCIYDNINYLLKEIKKVSEENTHLIFDIADKLLIKYPYIKDSMSLEVENSSFK